MRWLCHQCGERFNVAVNEARVDHDPSLPPGQAIKYKCPYCGSDKLAGAANSDPFKPKIATFK